MRTLLLKPDAPVFDPRLAQSEVLKSAKWLLIVTAILVVFGLTMLYSASYGVAGLKYFRNQLIWITLGLAAGSGVFLVGFRTLSKYCIVWMIAVFILLMIALCFPPINGACRWIKIRLPGLEFSLQPSEFAKIAVALFTARYCSENLRTFNNLRGPGSIWILAFGVAAGVGGVLAGKDLGTTVLIGCVAVGTMLAAGLALRYLIVPLTFLSVIGVYIYFFNPVRLARVVSFTRPEEMKQNKGYQLWNSLLALGSGNWFGIGFMESRMKAKYLPEAHTDFIMAIVGEELGFLAMVIVIALYVAFTYFAMKIALLSESRLGMLIAFAVTLGISIQAMINLLVISGSAPTKGMPAPFVSYGGSNMIASLTGVGILLSVAMETISPGFNTRYQEAFLSKLSFLPFFRKYRRQK